MAESSAINKSLSVLGQVVHALNQGAVSFFHKWPVNTLNHCDVVTYTLSQLQIDSNPARRFGRFFGGIIDL